MENQELLQVIQIQTQFLQELRKYVDEKDLTHWGHINSLWDQEYASMQLLCHSQDQQRQAIFNLVDDLGSLKHCMDLLNQQQLPEFCSSVNGQFFTLTNELSQSCKTLQSMCLQNQSGLRILQQSHSTLEGELQDSREI